MKSKKTCIILLILFCLLALTGCVYNETKFGPTVEYIKKTMYVGDEMLLDTNLQSPEVEWSSSNPEVASVTLDGLVKALKAGDAEISAKYNGATCVVIINVYQKAISNDIDINIVGKQTVLINETTELKAIITSVEYEGSSQNINTNVIWSTSDETIATIDQTGVVTGLKPGIVTIRATLQDLQLNYKDVLVLVRTGEGVQDVVNNYIYNNLYVTTGDYDLMKINETVVNLVKSVEKSVIGVSAFANKDGTASVGTGTGGIYKRETIANGYKYTVFTNHHVIEEGKSVKVYLGDRDEYVFAEVVKSNEALDLAVLTFEHSYCYEPLKLGSIGSIANGDFVVAIGNPGGYDYYGSVSFGMVSCYNRPYGGKDMIYVQHDTPINPGNSGGPLFNLKGEVVGINTLKFVSADIEGMGFSIAMEIFLDYLK